MSDLEKIILELIKIKPAKAGDFINKKRELTNKKNLKPPSNANLLAVYRQLVKNNRIKKQPWLEKFLTKRPTRTLSGVAVISVLTKPFKCPGNCVYCPSEPAMPKSYLSNEPAVMRAIMNQFDPHKQVTARIKALENNGHSTDKIELIVLGGTWSHYEKKYQDWFIKRCFDACNQYGNKSYASRNIKKAQKKNETAKHRIIGLILETRPDFINDKEIKQLRKLGCTRVQLGVQAIDNKILKLNKRGHSTAVTIKATELLKRTGFKIDYHFMPNLAGSNPEKDLAMYEELFNSPYYQPDHIKIYPTVVNKHAELYKLWQQKKWQPYTDKQLQELLIKMKLITPYYVRINRLIRDIPEESIATGNKITNLRQVIQKIMHKDKKSCHCIRCREAKDKVVNVKDVKLYTDEYRASHGTEFFISFEDKKRQTLFAFARLRFNDRPQNNIFPELKNAALIRELHTYGKLTPLDSNDKNVQHLGFGKKLMHHAEKIARENNFEKIAVIAGVGVRDYYKKLGYKLEGTYMVKEL